MKIYDKSQGEYLQGQQVIMELCMDIHTPSSQKRAAKSCFLASCFLALVPALTRIKVTVFGHINSEERGTVSARGEISRPYVARRTTAKARGAALSLMKCESWMRQDDHTDLFAKSRKLHKFATAIVIWKKSIISDIHHRIT